VSPGRVQREDGTDPENLLVSKYSRTSDVMFPRKCVIVPDNLFDSKSNIVTAVNSKNVEGIFFERRLLFSCNTFSAVILPMLLGMDLDNALNCKYKYCRRDR